MTVNIDELSSIYKKIVALEIIGRFSDCGMVWNKIEPKKYTTSWQDQDVLWDAYLSKMSDDNIILDFRKNSKFFLSINSIENSYISDFYNDIDINKEEFNSFVEIQKLPGCN